MGLKQEEKTQNIIYKAIKLNQIMGELNITNWNLEYIEENGMYWGFHEKGTLSYLCALGIDRKSPLHECTLQVPFI